MTRMFVMSAIFLAGCGGIDQPSQSGPDKPGPKERELLQGSWQFVSVERDGEQEKADVSKRRLVFAGDSLTLWEAQKSEKMTFTLGPEKSPKEIDITPLEGREKDQVIKGIYLLEGDLLKLCTINRPKGTEPRPREFRTTPEDNQVLLLARRTNR